jgi:cytidylate kinase
MAAIEGLRFAAAYNASVVVTISNEYFTGALAIAKLAAEQLGYEYVDQQLPVVVAKRLNVTPEEVEASEDTARTLGERWITSLERATPELAVSSTEPPFDEELLRAVQDAVREYASHGNTVIVGRGGGAILGARPDVLRVFMYAPREWRVAHVVDEMRVSLKQAEEEVDRVDRARAAYLRDCYGTAFGDPHNHDLCIDTSQFERSKCAALIVQAVRAKGA